MSDLETINQVCEILASTSKLLSMVLCQPVELRITSPSLDAFREPYKSSIDNTLLQNHIIDLVCSHFMISIAELRKKSRQKPIPDARKVAANILNSYVTGIKPAHIASLLNFHRSSTYANIQACEELMVTDKKFRFHHTQVLNSLKKSIAV